MTKLARERKRDRDKLPTLYMFYLYFFKCKMLAHNGRPQTQSNFLAYEYCTNKKRTKSTTNESRKNKYTTSVFILCTNFSTIHFALATICSQKLKTRRNEWLRNIYTNHRRGFSLKKLKYIYLSIDNPLIDEIFF